MLGCVRVEANNDTEQVPGVLPEKVEAVLDQLSTQEFPSFDLDEILKSLPAEKADKFRLQVEELETSPAALSAALLDILSSDEKNTIDLLDGMCVATPSVVRLKRVSNAGATVVFTEFAKEFAGLIAETCPEAQDIVKYQADIRDAADSIVFLKQYADEYADLLAAGVDKQTLDTQVFVGFEEKRAAARVSLEKMSVLLSGLLEKDFGQFEGMIKGIISIVLQKLTVILGDDQTQSMAELSMLGDLPDAFFAEASKDEQAIIEMFLTVLQKKLMENHLFVVAVQGVRDYVCSTYAPNAYADFVYVEDCDDAKEMPSKREVVVGYHEKAIFTDLPVTIDPSLTVDNGVCGRIIRNDNGVATEIVIGEHIEIKKLSEVPVEQIGRLSEVKMAKRFVVLFSAPEAKE